MLTLTVTTEELDLAAGGTVREQLHRAVAEGARSIVLDLSGVRFCDSSGVGVLIAARRLMRSRSGELRLVLPEARDGGCCAEVHRIFGSLGVHRLFEIHPDLASAAASAAAPRLPAPRRSPAQ